MSEKLTIIKSLDKLPKDKTDWSKVKNMTEEEIVAAAESDPDAQLITAKELRETRRVHPPKKESSATSSQLVIKILKF